MKSRLGPVWRRRRDAQYFGQHTEFRLEREGREPAQNEADDKEAEPGPNALIELFLSLIHISEPTRPN